MTPTPPELFDLYRDAPRDGNAMREIAWLRKTIRPAVRDMVVLQVFGDPEAAKNSDAPGLAMDACTRLDWPLGHAQVAYAAEQKEAQMKADELLNRLEQRIRQLAYERAQGSRMLSEARRLASDELFVPTELLMETITRIVQATIGTGRARRAG